MRLELIGSTLSYFEYFAEQRKRRPEEKEYIPVSEVIARTLDALSGRKNINWDDEEKEELVQSWFKMKAWEDTAQGLAELRTKYIVYVPLSTTVEHPHLRALEFYPHQWHRKHNDRHGMVHV